MKIDKPERIQIKAQLDLSGLGGWKTPARQLLDGCKRLDRDDFITFDGFYCYPVKTLRAILETFERDSMVHIHPGKAYSMTFQDVSPAFQPEQWQPVYTPVYNALALREDHSASIQRIYSARRETVAAWVAEFTTESIDNAPPVDPWVEKAVLKKAVRFDQDSYLTSAGNIATDGYRIHYNPRLFNRKDSPWRERAERFIVSGRDYPNIITLDGHATQQLIKACRLAVKQKGPFILNVNGKLEYSIQDDNVESAQAISTEGSITVGYQHSGKDVKFRINPHYLLDAIGKPGKVTTIRILSNRDPVYVTDGSREALIMPISIN
jgi:hypothetical protein